MPRQGAEPQPCGEGFQPRLSRRAGSESRKLCGLACSSQEPGGLSRCHPEQCQYQAGTLLLLHTSREMNTCPSPRGAPGPSQLQSLLGKLRGAFPPPFQAQGLRHSLTWGAECLLAQLARGLGDSSWQLCDPAVLEWREGQAQLTVLTVCREKLVALFFQGTGL